MLAFPKTFKTMYCLEVRRTADMQKRIHAVAPFFAVEIEGPDDRRHSLPRRQVRKRGLQIPSRHVASGAALRGLVSTGLGA